MLKRFAGSLSLCCLLLTFGQGQAMAETPAKLLFGKKSTPAALVPSSYGSYARGCLAGGAQVATDGPYWQVMRLSRNRNWGHPALVDYVERLANDAAKAGEWRGLLVGDMAQPRGGPMLTGHASHQIGLDADLWLMPMPNRRLSARERENLSAVSTVNFKTNEVNRRVWTDNHVKLLKRAASDKGVARIFVNPIIKKELCRVSNRSDRKWLRKIRPWHGHHYHFHVRLACPKGSTGCVNQAAPPRGNGCGAQLEAWFKPPPPSTKRSNKSAKRTKKPILTLARLPSACQSVLNADAKGGLVYEPITQVPQPKPRQQIANDLIGGEIVRGSVTEFFDTANGAVPFPAAKPAQ